MLPVEGKEPKEGIKVDPQKVKTITKWSWPTKFTEIRNFLGFYYRMFVKDFSKNSFAPDESDEKSEQI